MDDAANAKSIFPDAFAVLDPLTGTLTIKPLDGELIGKTFRIQVFGDVDRDALGLTDGGQITASAEAFTVTVVDNTFQPPNQPPEIVNPVKSFVVYPLGYGPEGSL